MSNKQYTPYDKFPVDDCRIWVAGDSNWVSSGDLGAG